MIEKWLLSDHQAISFVKEILAIVETWDDLIDKDKPITDSDINSMMKSALIDIPRNEFYRANFNQLSPLIEVAIYDWLTANKMETERSYLETAYGLKCSGQSLIVMCAAILGGSEHAVKVNDEVRRSGETWKEYATKIKERA